MLFRLELPGQVPPGKSQQKRDGRSGNVYSASPLFYPWLKVQKALNQYPARIFAGRFLLRVRYTPGDLRSRNVAGMQDAIMHYLENGGRTPKKKVLREVWKLRRRWIGDDEMIVDVDWKTLDMDRENPRAIVEVWSR